MAERARLPSSEDFLRWERAVKESAGTANQRVEFDGRSTTRFRGALLDAAPLSRRGLLVEPPSLVQEVEQDQ